MRAAVVRSCEARPVRALKNTWGVRSPLVVRSRLVANPIADPAGSEDIRVNGTVEWDGAVGVVCGGVLPRQGGCIVRVTQFPQALVGVGHKLHCCLASGVEAPGVLGAENSPVVDVFFSPEVEALHDVDFSKLQVLDG